MKTTKYFIALLLIFISGCGDLFVDEPAVNYNMQDFETVSQIIKDNYPFLQYKNINWDSVYTYYKSQVQNSTGDEILTIFYKMFREFKDAQIELFTEGGYPIITYLWERESDSRSFSPEVVNKYLNAQFKFAGNDRIEYEILPGNIGYVHFTTFEKGSWINDFDLIMKYFAGTKGIIIDVRNNIGGRTTMTDHIVSYFIDESVTGNAFNKDGDAWPWTVEPNSENHYANPVVVLINGASFSASEVFVDMMGSANNVIIVGTTTGGGGGSTKEFLLPSGKEIRIPTAYFKRLNGEMIEWKGVPPDTIITQTEMDVDNLIDKQLEYAISYLK
ncbi:MAG: S41 family peptidase [bacterium]